MPKERIEQACAAAEVLGEQVFTKFPFVAGGRPVSDDPADLLLDQTWRPALSITGAGGLPVGDAVRR